MRSPAFAHGQLYVALSRAENRQSIMCLLPSEHIIEGIPYTENVVYPPFIDAANGQSQPKLPNSPTPPLPDLPAPPPPQPIWTVQHEIGDGACGFRAIARRFLEILSCIYKHANRLCSTLQTTVTTPTYT